MQRAIRVLVGILLLANGVARAAAAPLDSIYDLMRDGDFQAAMEELNAVPEKQRSIDWRLRTAVCWANLGEDDKAQQTLRAAEQIVESQDLSDKAFAVERAWETINRPQRERPIVEASRGNCKRAMELIGRELEKTPDDPELLELRGKANFSGRRDEAANEAAFADFAKAIELDPTAERYLNRAIFYHFRDGTRKFESAELLKAAVDVQLADLSEVIRRKPLLAAYYLRADIHIDREEYQLAIDDYSQMINRAISGKSAAKLYLCRAALRRQVDGEAGCKDDLASAKKLDPSIIYDWMYVQAQSKLDHVDLGTLTMTQSNLMDLWGQDLKKSRLARSR